MPYPQRVLTVPGLDSVEARTDADRLSVPVGKTTELSARLARDVGSSVSVNVLLKDPW